MISGAHAIIYSTKPESDRAFLRDVLKLTHVDVGGGWLIFGLPPSEVAVHPSEKNDFHELYLMCDDLEGFAREMARHNILIGPRQDQGWGILAHLTLPGGGKLGVYQPRHARPRPMTGKMAKARTRKRTASNARSLRARKSRSKRGGARNARTK